MRRLSLEEVIEMKELFSLVDDMCKIYSRSKANYMSGEKYPRLYQDQGESDADFKKRLTEYKTLRENGYYEFFPTLKEYYDGKVSRLRELFIKCTDREF